MKKIRLFFQYFGKNYTENGKLTAEVKKDFTDGLEGPVALAFGIGAMGFTGLVAAIVYAIFTYIPTPYSSIIIGLIILAYCLFLFAPFWSMRVLMSFQGALEDLQEKE